jgi:acetyl-CoA carboxylase biotin carboxyl carrier protein
MSHVEVRSEIPGSVISIDAAIGDALAEDDPVITVESMKMEIPIPAPIGGRLKEILVEEGEAIAALQVVAILET